ncbi:MAG: SGNH/GDSL hydrolase family protein [Planctomycetota bacterium]
MRPPRSFICILFAAILCVHQSAPVNRTKSFGDFANLSESGFQPHPYFVYELRPGAFFPWSPGSAARINAMGARGREWQREKDVSTRRVLCIGGSDTFGIGLAENLTFPSQLLLKLNIKEWDVANAGVPGYTSHETASVFSLKWLDYEPAVIVINDLDADVFAHLSERYRNDYSHLWKIWTEAATKDINNKILTLGERVLQNQPGDVQKKKDALAASNTRALETNLEFILNIAKGRDIRSIIILPHSELGADPVETRAIARIRDAARRIVKTKNVEFVDLEQIPNYVNMTAAERAESAAGRVSEYLLKLK